MAMKTSSSVNKAMQAFKEASRRRQMKEDFTQFCNETSFTALVRIYNASCWVHRIVWTVIFVSMFVWLIVQCYWLLDKYFDFPVESKLDLQAAKVLDFPSVTVCNLNPLKKSAMNSDDRFNSLVQYSEELNVDDVLYDFLYDSFYFNWGHYYDYGFNPYHYYDYAYPDYPSYYYGDAFPVGKRKKRDTGSQPRKDPLSNKIASSGETANDNPASSNSGSPPKSQESMGLQQLLNLASSEPISDSDSANNEQTFDFEDILRADIGEEDRDASESIFGEKRRIRRDADREEILKNNSFNKWDALSDENLNTSYYETRGVEYLAAMEYATLTVQMNETVVQNSGHNLNDLLLSCTFNGYQCSPSNFTYFHSHKFGNCYTFNSAQSATVAQTKFPGPDFGLTLEMYIQQDEYVAVLAAEAGVRVLVHPRGSAPFPEDDGISILPARSTSTSLRMVDVIRLEPPHGTCDYDGSSTDLYASTLNMSYSKLSCLKSCYQTIAMTNCNCSLPMYIIPSGANICNMTDPAVDRCTSALPDTVPEEYTLCNEECPQPCHEVDYDMLVFSAAWPSQAYKSHLDTKVSQSNYLLLGSDNSGDDFVKLNVYFADLLYQKVEQQRAYEIQNLLGDIGGQLGLWLGLSAITIGELCGLILILFRSATAVAPAPVNDRHDDDKKVRFNNASNDLRLSDVDDTLVADVKAQGYV